MKNTILNRNAGFAIFLGGRATALMAVTAVQIVLARRLPVGQYAAYAAVVAGASLVQTLGAFGIPRLASLYFSPSEAGFGPRGLRRLLRLFVLGRISSTAALAGLGALCLVLFAPVWLQANLSLSAGGGALALFSALQTDTDAIALARGQQRASRAAAGGEPVARLALLLVLNPASAVSVLWISTATAAVAASGLLTAVVLDLRHGMGAAERPGSALGNLTRLALGGQAGTLSWLLTSPSVVRLIAARVLPTPVFAAFSFAQALVIGVQRYTPGTLLWPFVEPIAMARSAGGHLKRLRSVLGLVVKIEALGVAAAVAAVMICGPSVVATLSHGRYGAAAAFLPWLLVLIAANTAHRSYEIAALAVGRPSVLARGLGISIVWLAVMAGAAGRFGVLALLLCPIGDAITRLGFVQCRLGRSGLGAPLGPGALTRLALLALGVGAGLAFAARSGDDAGRAALAICAAVVVLASAPLLFRRREVALLFALLRRPSTERRPLRVAILTPLGAGGQGGVDRLMDALRPELAANASLQVRFIVTRGNRRWLSPIVTIAALGRLAVALALRKVDVVHINLGANGSCWRKAAFAALCRWRRAPYVLHLHGSGFDAFWRRQGSSARAHVDRLFLGAARVVVLGRAWRDLVEQQTAAAKDRIDVLPNACAPIPPIQSGEPPHILFLGRLEARKGVDTLVAALARLPDRPPWRATLAGDGAVPGVQAALSAAGLLERIDCPGWLGPEAVRRKLSQSDILVLPSREENLPMAIVEAFAAGLAVVATPVGAIPDLVVDGETGLLIPVDDVAALASALARLIAEPDLRARLGAAACAEHARRLHISTYAERLIGIWRLAGSIGLSQSVGGCERPDHHHPAWRPFL